MGVAASNCGLQRRRRRRPSSDDRLEGELGRNLVGEVVAVPPAGAGDDDDGRGSPWSDLPPELAGLVFCRLLSHGDRRRFRAVCSDWRLAAREQVAVTTGPSSSSLQLPPSLPWLALDRRTYQSLPDGEVHRFADGPGIMVCRGSFDGWLLYHRNGYRDIRSSFLWNPFSGAVLDLPSRCDDAAGGEPMCFVNAIKRKIVVCSPDLVAAAVEYTSLIFHLPNKHSSWARTNPNICCHDIAFHHGKLYSINNNDELFVHEFFTTTAADRGGGSARVTASSDWAAVTDARPPREHLGNHGYHLRFTSYLVASLAGKLLLVRWSLPDELFSGEGGRLAFSLLSNLITVRVFEADMEARRWTEVTDIGDDQALFVSATCSRALRLPDNNGGGRHGFLRGNRVFIVGSDLGRRCGGGGGGGGIGCCCCSCGVYDMSNGRFSTVSLKRWRAGHEQRSRDTSVNETMRSEWFFPSEL
uniref:KIB1-4 beta-propeller domain-containing protein n=1 Tax=Oryza glumipatula TaxID=40148 RepID=A0A0E0BFG5_9ORYZ